MTVNPNTQDRLERERLEADIATAIRSNANVGKTLNVHDEALHLLYKYPDAEWSLEEIVALIVTKASAARVDVVYATSLT